MDRGVVSPGLSGATTTIWEPRSSGNPAWWGAPAHGLLQTCGGVVNEREHRILATGSCMLVSVQGGGVARRGGVAVLVSGLSYGGAAWHVCLARRGA